MDRELESLASRLTEAQRKAAIEGRVRDCPYNHPKGTRCPNCADWPYKKGGAMAFVEGIRALALRDHLKKENER